MRTVSRTKGFRRVFSAGLVPVGLAAGSLLAAACQRAPDVTPPPTASSTVADALARYNALGPQATPAERCAQAGRVVEAQAEAHNQLALTEWRARQAADCAALPPAGLADT